MEIIVIGAGINGVVAAIELKRRGHVVTLLDPGPLPHPLAASTDISKAVRSCYGADEDYTEMAERSIARWHEWNREFGIDLYHENGVLFICQAEMEPGGFEHETFELLKMRGHKVERIGPERLRERFPMFNAERFRDGVYDPAGGFAESGRVVSELVKRAAAMGVELREGTSFASIDEGSNGVNGVVSRNGERLRADAVVATTGSWTPHLFPETASFFRSTGHPVFHLRPNDPAPFQASRFPMFGSDITRTGYYGFPATPEGLVKFGLHGPGREMTPDSAERLVTKRQEEDLRAFLRWALPSLADVPIVYTRICLYCDTNDGDFWIAGDPERSGFFIAAGDGGHGFKFAPVLGEVIADAVERKNNPLLKKFRWRPEVKRGERHEAARQISVSF